jgi:hypothetical protein
MIGPALHPLLDTAVEIARTGIASHNRLTLKVDDQAQDTVGGRVLRTHIERYFLLNYFFLCCIGRRHGFT